MIKIYFGENILYLSDRLERIFATQLHQPDTILVDVVSQQSVDLLVEEMKKQKFRTGILLDQQVEVAMQMLCRHFTCIEAAGGIVENEKKEILFIHRSGKWDLPKGKLEQGELPELCAQREIMEETGMQDLTLLNKTGVTYHTYQAFGKYFLKTNHWYHFSGKSDVSLMAQAEEDITEVKWFDQSQMHIPLSNTYPSITDILHKFQEVS
jgi:8-oxo-dGTP pyrophosphatase MutT (NUDIX family)